MEPTKPTALGETTELVETTSLAEPAELTSLAEPKYVIFTNVVEPIPHVSPIIPNQAPLDIPKINLIFYHIDGIVGFHQIVTHHKTKQDMLLLSPDCKAFVSRMDNIKILTCVEEAFNDPKCAEAMNIEIEMLQENNT
ncbi:unnamed protein product [Prunus armeniaca]